MKAVTYSAFQIPPEIKNLPDPIPPAHGVVVRVMATGICRSDWHGWMGHDSDIKLPHVPGHELAGVVAAEPAIARTGSRLSAPRHRAEPAGAAAVVFEPPG